MNKDALIVIECALLLILCGFLALICSERDIDVATPEPLQLDIPLDDGSGHETVIYGIDSEVE